MCLPSVLTVLVQKRHSPLCRAALPKFKMIQRHHHERMKYLARRDEFGNLRDWHEPRHNVFAVVPLDRMARFAIFHEHRVASVAHDGGVGKYFADDLRPLAFVTRFLAQLAQAADDWGGV